MDFIFLILPVGNYRNYNIYGLCLNSKVDDMHFLPQMYHNSYMNVDVLTVMDLPRILDVLLVCVRVLDFNLSFTFMF